MFSIRAPGTARRIGSSEAYGRIVVWTDSDMTYPNERIPEFVQYLIDHPETDQVVGARTTEQGTHKLLRVPFILKSGLPLIPRCHRFDRKTVSSGQAPVAAWIAPNGLTLSAGMQ